MTPNDTTLQEDAEAPVSDAAAGTPTDAVPDAAGQAGKEAAKQKAKKAAEEAAGIERRTEERRTMHVRTHLSFPGRAPMEVRSIDVSMNGMAVAADTNLPAGASLSVSFRLPLASGGAYNVQTSAAVSYSVFSSANRGFKIGLRFNTPGAELQKALALFVKS